MLRAEIYQLYPLGTREDAGAPDGERVRHLCTSQTTVAVMLLLTLSSSFFYRVVDASRLS